MVHCVLSQLQESYRYVVRQSADSNLNSAVSWASWLLRQSSADLTCFIILHNIKIYTVMLWNDAAGIIERLVWYGPIYWSETLRQNGQLMNYSSANITVIHFISRML